MLHEKLRCYRMAIDLAKEIAWDTPRWPTGFGYLSDQIKRAMASAVLNCAEGNTRRGSKDRKRFFQIARASISEVSACVDLLFVFKIISSEKGNIWKTTLSDISKMLYALK